MNSLTKIVPNVKKYSDYLFDIKKEEFVNALKFFYYSKIFNLIY